MPVYDFRCESCGDTVEVILSVKDGEEFTQCSLCDGKMVKVLSGKAPSFKLKYNPKTDMVDWSGNTSRYWDDYNAKKEAGQKPRIPELDGQ